MSRTIKCNTRRNFLNQLCGVAIGAPLVNAALPSTRASADEPKKKGFKETVTDRLDELTYQTGSSGPIYQEINAINDSLSVLSARLQKCNEMIGDANDIKAVNLTLQEIKRILGLP